MDLPIRILLVEDDALVRELLCMQLLEDGAAVETAESAEDALLKFRAEAFDLVVTDQSMPGMTGCELATMLKSVAPDLPVVLLTGFGEIEGGRSSEISAVLSKPVAYSELRAVIHQAAGR